MDVIGIGALNIDYIKSMSVLESLISKLRKEFEPGDELFRSNETIENIIHNFGRDGFDYVGPGGSAFNTIRCLAQLNLGFTLGFVGVVGDPSVDCDLNDFIKKYSIDSRHIYKRTGPSGKCISVYWTWDGSRSLMTAPGVNNELNTILSNGAKLAELSDYVAEAKWVHLSSLVDSESFAKVIKILKNAKIKNQCLTISFDPGSEYCREPTDIVKDAIKISDYLFLNGKEFLELADYREVREKGKKSVDDKEIASRIFKSIGCSNLMIVLKAYNSTRFFQKFGDSTLTRGFWKIPLWPNWMKIKDDTGAGDVFTAGFIATQLVPALRFDMKSAISFSSSLVKTKLKIAGCEADSRYQDVLNKTLKDIQKEGLDGRELIKTFLSEYKIVITTSIISFFIGWYFVK